MAVPVGEVVNGTKSWMDAGLVRGSGRNEVGVAAAIMPRVAADSQFDTAGKDCAPLVSV